MYPKKLWKPMEAIYGRNLKLEKAQNLSLPYRFNLRLLTLNTGLFVALLIGVGGVCNAELVEVEVRSGNTLHGFAVKYLKAPAEWPKIYEINKDTIKDPDRIFPGQIVKIPIEMLKDKVGDLTKLKKKVKVKKREGGDWKKGKENERLFPEDGIMTGKSSYARVDFLVGSHLKIYENSLIYLKPTRKKTAVASLLEGGLNVEQAKIITPSAEIIPGKNSRYDVNIDKEKTTKISVRAGAVDVKAKGKIVTVMKGYRTKVKMNNVPDKPILLPLSGEEALEYDTKNVAFHLEVSKTKDFEDTVKDEKTFDLTQDYIKKGLAPGQYFWRAAVIDKDGFEGDFSDPRSIYIGLYSGAVVELTGFQIINRKEGIMKVTGFANNAVKIVVNGYPAKVTEKGKFSTNIILAAGQDIITVTAISREGVVIRKYRRIQSGDWIPAN